MKINYSHLLLGLLLPISTLYAETPLTPPNAKPGECYAKVVLPAEYETVEEEVLVKEPSEKISIEPAVYDTVKEEVEVIPESHMLTPVEATFKETKETIEIKPSIKSWKTSTQSDALPVNPAILSILNASGIDVQGVTPGICYKEYFLPAKFKKTTEEILVQPEHKKAVITPAQFEDTEKVVTIKPATKKLIEVAPVYEEIEEKVLISPEKTMWKKGQNPAQKLSGATGEIMCLVKVPAKYKTLKKKVLKEKAHTEVVDVPAQTKVLEAKTLTADAQATYETIDPIYITVEKTSLESEAVFRWLISDEAIEEGLQYTGHQVCLVEEPSETIEVTKMELDTPATVTSDIVPATYEMVETQEMVTEAKEIRTAIEAEYKTISKKKKVTDERIGWKRILCQTNMSKEVIASIQSALNDKGYDAGTPDGLLGTGTKNALDKYQRENNLATGGITYETLKSLGIQLNH